jgi:hypothetical protein
LLQLHKYGILTTGSQPACHTLDYIDKTWKDPQTEQMCGRWWVETEQKSFVEFYIPSCRSSFVSLLKLWKQKCPTVGIEMSTVNLKTRKFWSSLSKSTDSYPLTRERSHAEKEQVAKQPWTVHTSLPRQLTVKDMGWHPRLRSSICIVMCYRTWNQGNLVDDLLSLCQHL